MSEPVFNARSVSAAAVSAHECGHAVQHPQAYIPLKFRSAIVPIVRISSSLQQYIFMASMAAMFVAPSLGKLMLLVTLIIFVSQPCSAL